MTMLYRKIFLCLSQIPLHVLASLYYTKHHCQPVIFGQAFWAWCFKSLSFLLKLTLIGLNWDQKLGDQQMAFPRGQLQWSVSVAVDGLDVGTFSNQEMDNEDVAFSENYFHDEIRNPNSQMWLVHIAKCFCFWKLTHTFSYLNFLTLPHTFSYIIIFSRTFLQFSGLFRNFLDFLRLHTYIRVIITGGPRYSRVWYSRFWLFADYCLLPDLLFADFSLDYSRFRLLLFSFCPQNSRKCKISPLMCIIGLQFYLVSKCNIFWL